MVKKLFIMTVLPVIAGCATYRGNSSMSTDSVIEQPVKTDSYYSETKSADQTKSTSKVDDSRKEFSLSLYRTASASQADKKQNLIISPYSAGEAMSMLMEGAAGQTKEEIVSALCGSSFAGVAPKSDEDVTITSANSVWLRSGFPILDSYSNTLEQSYSAQIYHKDFNDKSTVADINSWCSDHTNGKIPSIIDQIRPDMMLFLLNALYFNAPWQNAFKPSDTLKRSFYGVEGESKVDFMHQTKDFQYASIEGNQIAMLPYKGGRYGMLVILPSKNKTVDDIISTIDSEYLKKISDGLSRVRLMVALPKFKLESEMVLNSVLKDMGINRAFANGADFSAMTPSSVVVDQVKQKVFIEVSEKGTEAAAVTSIGVRLTSVAAEPEIIEMNINRPFVFFIMDRQTEDILFAGNIRTIK